LANVIEEQVPAALDNSPRTTASKGNDARLKARLRPMRGLKTPRSAAVVILTTSSQSIQQGCSGWPPH